MSIDVLYSSHEHHLLDVARQEYYRAMEAHSDICCNYHPLRGDYKRKLAAASERLIAARDRYFKLLNVR